jgi:hypothetical protein
VAGPEAVIAVLRDLAKADRIQSGSLAMRLSLVAFASLALAACQSPVEGPSACRMDSTNAAAAGDARCRREWIDVNLKMNDIQVLGTHNSYKDWIAPAEFEVFMARAPGVARTVEYAHEPIPAQLEAGVRQFEIDIYHDPQGGLFADPLLRRLAVEQGKSTPELGFRNELMKPGFKVLHIADLDCRTTCPTFVACLKQIRDWSVKHPDHAPMFVMIDAKMSPASWPGAAPVKRFDAAAWDALDKELLSVFPREALITPADIQGEYASVREGVLAGNWPTLKAARGKVMFGVLASREATEPYRNGPGGITARPMFVRATAADPDAAWLMWDDPIANQDAIQRAVKDGFLVRTRTEQDTVEVRANTTVKREAAFASGGQFISTDYYKPNLAFSPYSVAMPGGAVARCNPVRAAEKCGGIPIE